MPIITDIKFNQGASNRVWVFVDGEYCTSIRSRTFPALQLNIGDEITCQEIKKRENYVFKDLYEDKWGEEKIRIDYIKKWFETYIPNLEIEKDGFGADTNEFIEGHPQESGGPDLKLTLRGTDSIVIFLEVTGTKYKQGDDYWIRPDKIQYMQNHPEKDIWFALHYLDQKHIIWIKPLLDKKYHYVVKNIKGADEHFVIFNTGDEEIKTSKTFKDYVDNKISSI
jgi:hypothetical protein